MTASAVPNKLSTFTKFVYGLGDWGASAATTARSFFWLYFLVSVVGIDVRYAGYAFIIGRIWDGINDPIVGILSDRISTRWGRRRPFLLIGAIPFGIGFFLIFNAPPVEGNVAAAIYYSLAFMLYDTAFTIVNAPYAALTPELTDDYDERASLAGWRMANSILAALITAATFSLLAQNVFANWFEGPDAVRKGFAVAAAIWGVVIAITPLIVFAFIREPERNVEQEPLDLKQLARDIWANVPFRIGALVYLLAFTAVDIIANLLVFFLVYYIRIGFPSDLVLGVVLLSAFLTMPLTVRWMRRYGKKEVYMGMMLFWLVVMIVLSVLPPEADTLVLICAVLAGFGYGAANAIPWAIVADVIEVDEWRSGQRREGAYSSILVTSRKFTNALAIFVITQILALTGFIEGTGGGYIEQPALALTTLRIFVGAVPAVLLLISIIAIRNYPLTKEAHAELVAKLTQRRAERAEAAAAVSAD